MSEYEKYANWYDRLVESGYSAAEIEELAHWANSYVEGKQ